MNEDAKTGAPQEEPKHADDGALEKAPSNSGQASSTQPTRRDTLSFMAIAPIGLTAANMSTLISAFVKDVGINPRPKDEDPACQGHELYHGWGINCGGPIGVYTCSSFACEGGALDDFECIFSFSCTSDYDCYDSFDAGDCETTFRCASPNPFSGYE